MFDSNKINTAFRKLDLAAMAALIGDDGLVDPGAAAKFIVLLRESGALMLQIEHKVRETARDRLVDKSRDLLSRCADPKNLADFEAHVEDAKIAERGFREIFDTVRKSEISKRTPAEQVWGMIHRTEIEFAEIEKEIAEQFAEIGKEKHPSLDPRQLKLKDLDGNRTVTPDAAVSVLTKSLGDTLVTLAYFFGWFDPKTGAILVPPWVEVSEKIMFQAGTLGVLAANWKSLEKAWDRSRLFGARFKLNDHDIRAGDRVERRAVLEVQAPGRSELMDRISVARVGQVFFQSQMDYKGVEEEKAKLATGAPIPLAPGGFLSLTERASAAVLDGNYCVPVFDESSLIDELPLKVWLRGYAFYAKVALKSDGDPILAAIEYSEAALIEGLQSVGLSTDQALTFMAHTTFGRGTSDLFDAPLIKTGAGGFWFFSPAYQSPALGEILLSRISSLNRRRDADGNAANDGQIQDKGHFYEGKVLDLFRKAKIEAHTFTYTLAGTEYDCDVAALLGETLFIFECKNRSLPMGHVPSLYYFLRSLKQAKRQVKRIVQQLTDHPEILQKHFGGAIRWTRLVPVVLHSLPWSFGQQDDVYVYDASALAHLIQEGFTSVIALSKVGEHEMRRRHRYMLRKGSIPTAAELEKEMENPNQLRLHAVGWEISVKPLPISDTMLVALPEWTQRTATIEEQFLALGSSPEDAARVAKDFDEDFPSMLDKVRSRSAEPRVKVGRNDPCPCGSGKKFKRCCLDRPVQDRLETA